MKQIQSRKWYNRLVTELQQKVNPVKKYPNVIKFENYFAL